MRVARRQILASTIAVLAAGCSGGTATPTPTPAPTPPPSPTPSPSPSPSPTPTPSGPYPSYNISPIPADSTGMTSTAVDLSGHIKLGWNAGNTLEAIGGETAWGNPPITQDLMNK